MRSEIFPQIPVKSRHCTNVDNVDNVDKMKRYQAGKGEKAGRYTKKSDARSMVEK